MQRLTLLKLRNSSCKADGTQEWNMNIEGQLWIRISKGGFITRVIIDVSDGDWRAHVKISSCQDDIWEVYFSDNLQPCDGVYAIA